MEKAKQVRGRAHLRKQYNKRFLAINSDAKRKIGPNSQSQ
ncbi:40S ribosomal protein S30 [Tritrichomonas foetus]|uniref:40S ribosomal protein S30 n=1 Tax=Tritrichomonas foetus TaxID=1144522 RepID=A0A1J4JDH7_9EUKA|nr:40S ribosomal protein S30 [Tritrichomonas foetus]|eukprot:OHS97254.1 40S ribosomal protein S30 [Tritrichomonas foetus]